MKVYIVFSRKDGNFLIDSLHTTRAGAEKREFRLHNGMRQRVYINGVEDTPVILKSINAQTYIITKSVRGQHVVKDNNGRELLTVNL